MDTLILIGLVGGLITGISPCILPMLPVIFFAGGVEAARTGTGTGTSASLFAGLPGAVTVDRRGAVAVAGAAGGPALTRGPRALPAVDVGDGDSTAVDVSGSRRAAAPSVEDIATGAPARAPEDAPTITQHTQRTQSTQSTARTRSWRPYLVIAGLVLSFSFFTLLGSVLLTALGLPQDLLRWLGLALLALIGLGMIVPSLEELLERPFRRIAALGSRRGATSRDKGAFLLGLGLGVLYVPCAGPVLAAITVAGATGKIGPGTVALTVSFAVGAALPLLVFALAGRRVAERVTAFKKHTRGIRVAGGVVMIALAVGLAFNLPAYLQRALPDYTGALQEQVDASGTVREALDLGGIVTDENRELANCSDGSPVLQDCGTAPALSGITGWLNTPQNSPLALSDLGGKVVLIDFWTYSCINCQRAIPHVNAWYDNYKDVGAGFEVIGVHTPEFAFERETRNVVAGAAALGVEYPVAQDNSYSTWTTYRNRYWPAEYLVDAEGTVRHIRFGEGGYEDTERLIRELLKAANPDVVLPEPTTVLDETPAEAATSETYLSATKVTNYAGTPDYTAGERTYSASPDQPQDTFSLSGTWDVDAQGATAVAGAGVHLAFSGTDVFTVLGGEGIVVAEVTDQDGTVTRSEVAVSGSPTLYPLLTGSRAGTGTVELSVPAGVQVFTFTFG